MQLLFNFMADRLEEFVVGAGLAGSSLTLGFTFSFPTQQLSLNSATLATWTKVNRQSIHSILFETTNCFSHFRKSCFQMQLRQPITSAT